ncbi:MAG: 2-oxoglutarate/2-oxoacid ferredoxin oxidoreductase subunit beta, partial [Aliidongia sp.]|nr:2-oxoglutarate/2-oxoacid ferredoxin oxidoreductase subunit beta [Aliidongia sp.]
RKLAPQYDPHDRAAAMNYLQERQIAGEIVTGLLYVEPDSADLHDHLGTIATPLNQLGESELCPGAGVLERLNAGLR